MRPKLQQYFPMIRTRNEILQIIYSSKELKTLFQAWEKNRQEEFLDFCSGARGVKMLYDCFAKEILNPETVPERLNELISLLLGKKAEIVQVLPNDNSRIADESSLIIMDILVKLDDGSIVNVEIQKIGYLFPGQRCACYSSDLLLRQYKQVRSQKTKETFSFRDIKSVYTIVFFENSSKEFKAFPNEYKHFFCQKSDTGLKLELLQKFLFVPLDIFLKSRHNKVIRNRLDAWLTFLSSDDPEDIIAVVEQYPDFKAMYEQVYDICRNMERVMGMFSEELRILDRNTVRYMVDEMQGEIDRQQKELDRQKEELYQKDEALSQKDKALGQKETALKHQAAVLAEKEDQIYELKKQIQEQERKLEAMLESKNKAD